MNQLMKPPEGYEIEAVKDPIPSEAKWILRYQGREVSRHWTRGAALLAAEKLRIERMKGERS